MYLPDWFKRHILPDYWHAEPSRHAPSQILVVTEEKRLGRLVQVNLERVGYMVSWPRDPEDALDELSDESTIRVIILDDALTGIDVSEMLLEIKSDFQSTGIPIVALLGASSSADTYSRFATGRDCFLRKPVNPIELVATVHRILRNRNNYSGGQPAWGSRI